MKDRKITPISKTNNLGVTHGGAATAPQKYHCHVASGSVAYKTNTTNSDSIFKISKQGSEESSVATQKACCHSRSKKTGAGTQLNFHAHQICRSDPRLLKWSSKKALCSTLQKRQEGASARLWQNRTTKTIYLCTSLQISNTYGNARL